MYGAPVEEIAFVISKLTGLSDQAHRFSDPSTDLLDAILEAAGKFAREEILPVAAEGDRSGARFRDGSVIMPEGWKALYQRWRESGWNALSGPEAYGGQGLPTVASAAVAEMWNSASMAFAIGPTLTLGAIDALEMHGSDYLKSTYLPKLVSGAWMGTMNLTEPQAGSDLALLHTRADRREDGTYRIFGQKIFITYGEHDLTENIVHLVLARLADAPAGVKGISLFLVPKFLVGEDGSIGPQNDVKCHSIEHKLGIHASPTCTMIFGDGAGQTEDPGAIGWLVGEENKGLACMFTMMNSARLYVGVQGLGVAEAAFQKARTYAAERKQGRAPSMPSAGPVAIIEHPDVARMLLTMKALTAAARSIVYNCAFAIDMGRKEQGESAKAWGERAGLLTPLAKAFATDVGVDVASLGMQVHGGMGYIEETGAARLLRDATIAPIYEGTNGIQSIDLVTRKLPLSGGRAVRCYLDELDAVAEQVCATNRGGFGSAGEQLTFALRGLRDATEHLLAVQAAGKSDDALSGATAYLRLFSLSAGAVLLAKAALIEATRWERVALARFYAENILPEADALKRQIIEGAASLKAATSVLAA